MLSDSDIPTKRREATEDRIGKFVRSGKLGSGGMGDVWKAWDSELHRWVALKFLRGGDADEVARFRREAQLAAKLSHPNIAAVYEIGEAEGRPFIAMEYVDGRTLKSLARDDRRRSVEIVRDAARGVAYAHAHGVVHHDVKPENVMMSTAGRVFVMDFGLARSVSADRSTPGWIIGTPSYMSPEQARGERTDARSDVYSLGATLFATLTGRPPHQESNVIALLRRVGEGEVPSPRSIDETIPRDLEAILLKSMDGSAAARYADAGALADDLDRWLRGDPVTARPPAAVSKVGRALKKRWPALGAAIALSVAGVTAAVLWRRADEARRAKLAQEEQVRREREAADRARNHVGAGQHLLEQARAMMREPEYDTGSMSALAQQAEAEFAAALALHPDTPEALLGVARACRIRRDMDGMRKAIDRAIDVSPTFVPAYAERVKLHFSGYDDAHHDGRSTPEDLARVRARINADLAIIERHAGRTPVRDLAEGLRAFAEDRLEDAERGIAAYLAAVPADGDAHFWRAHVLIHLKRYRDADDAFGRALRIDTQWAEAYINRASARRVIDPAGSEADVDKGIGLGCHNAEAFFLRGSHRLRRGQLRDALADHTQALAFEPDFLDALLGRGWVLLELRELALAEEDLKTALHVAPQSAQAHGYVGVLRERQGRPQEAINAYTRSIRIKPTLGAYANRALCLRRAGDLAGAAADFESALKLEPDSPDRAKVEAELAATRAMMKK